ncbi:MAG: M15 family metallopeptidase [Cyclobacteriaceae bacterium]|nr:M15 family metallopeptidase [Cyclobacteriaceae bacterium]UYN86351.1 MAG: M15 family metallopeptidase [Cyclobacteriaceae bacterium]
MKPGLILFCFSFLSAIVTAQDVDKNYLLGKFNPDQDARFVRLDDQHTGGSAKGAYLRKETYEAFIRMAEAAKEDGVKLTIISATRNYFQQKAIWERKWMAEASIKNEADRAKKILLFSSMPGTSRHHWGTDMDLNDLNNEYFDSGEGLKIYEWLKAHAHEYGFCQPYTSKVNGRTGYEEERWHWSYTPLSIPFLEAYKSTIKLSDIKDFLGSDTAPKLDVIVNYVDGVACR